MQNKHNLTLKRINKDRTQSFRVTSNLDKNISILTQKIITDNLVGLFKEISHD